MEIKLKLGLRWACIWAWQCVLFSKSIAHEIIRMLKYWAERLDKSIIAYVLVFLIDFTYLEKVFSSI